MPLIYDANQKLLSQTVRHFVAQRTPMRAVRAVIDRGDAYSTETWQQIAGEIGLAALTVPEEYEGAGASHGDIAVALRELGAGLVPSPLLGSAILATGALAALDDETAKRLLLPQLASGQITAALAVSERSCSPWIPACPATTAAGPGRDVTLSGTKTAVLNGLDADVLLVQAAAAEGIDLVLVRKGAPGLTSTADPAVDPTTAVASVSFTDTPAIRLSGNAVAALEKVADKANLAVAALQSGAIGACLAMMTEYAKIRYSFGQPIGTYQGIKHPIASIYCAHAIADAQLRIATEAADQCAESASADAAAARLLLNALYYEAATRNQFVHGGMGFTWEHDSHWYTKNALLLRQLLGNDDYQRDRLADKLGL
jgi:alkylation response protein AidB-like acyl-CoA dehydrogenase